MSIKLVINLAKIGSKNTYKAQANQEELISLVDLLEVEQIVSLLYNVDIFKLSPIKYKIVGNIVANLIQNCSITTDPIDVVKNINFIRFVEQTSQNKKEEVIQLDDPDVDYIQGNELDLSELVIEELILDIDPYIKKDSI